MAAGLAFMTTDEMRARTGDEDDESNEWSTWRPLPSVRLCPGAQAAFWLRRALASTVLSVRSTDGREDERLGVPCSNNISHESSSVNLELNASKQRIGNSISPKYAIIICGHHKKISSQKRTQQQQKQTLTPCALRPIIT